MAKEYLDKTGLTYLWGKIKAFVEDKVNAVPGTHTLTTAYSYTYAQILNFSSEGYGGADGATWAVASTTGVKPGDTVRLKISISDMNSAVAYVIGTVVSITNDTSLRVVSHGLDTTVVDGSNIIPGSFIKSIDGSYTVTCSAGGYVKLTDYSTLGIDMDDIVGYLYTSGSYLIILQFHSSGVWLYSHTALSNYGVSFRFFYI